MDISDWIYRFHHLATSGATVLDLACGKGRHGRFFLEKNCQVDFLDRDLSGVADLKHVSHATLLQQDLENGDPLCLLKTHYDMIVVTNYLHRPLFDHLMSYLKKDGFLLYETFALGNEFFGRPRNPNFLLKPNELFKTFQKGNHIVAFEQGQLGDKVIQRLCVQKGNRQNQPIPITLSAK